MSSATFVPPPAVGQPPEDQRLKLTRRASRRAGLFEPQLLKAALKQSFVMLQPNIQWKNPVMFVVEVGTVLTLVYTVAKCFGYPSAASLGYPDCFGLLAGAHAFVRELRLFAR